MKHFYFERIAIFLICLTLGLAYNTHESFSQDVKINEVMASNSVTLADENGDFSDWVELYNSGASPIDLAGYGFTDNPANPFKWTFPSVTIQAQGYLMVWASGKDRSNSAQLHTNFSINAAGEPLLLTHPDGTTVDEVPATAIPTDLSYGRSPDGGTQFLYFPVPTPGSTNNTTGHGALLEPPQFSHEGGFYDTPFSLTLTSTDPSASIIYTLDGSDPDPQNLSGKTYTYKNQYPQYPGDPFGELIEGSFTSHQYTTPIGIQDRSTLPDKLARISSTFDRTPNYFPDNPVFKGTVVKAKTVKSGMPPSEVTTQSYFISSESSQRYTFPVISMSIQEDAFFDYKKGIYVAGERFDQWRTSNTTGVADGGRPANYGRSGSEWEYPAHIEMFKGSEGRVLSQGIGVRTHGGWSTAHAAKSLRMYARNQYDASSFQYKFFPDRPYTNFKRLLLRNSGNDWGYTMFRDVFIQSMVGHMDFESMASQPSVLFVNGEYWGIHNIRERFDKYFMETMYGVDPENLDMLEGNWGIDEGDDIHYNQTLDYISKNPMSDDQHYEHVSTRIDISSFIDYQIAQNFIVNKDWPGNNIKMWRLRVDQFDPSLPKGHDGRWRWMLYDTDYGFGLYGPMNYTDNMLTFTTATNGPSWPNPPWSTFLFRELLKNQNFKNDFITRFTDQLNTAFKPNVVKEKINYFKGLYEPEIEEQIKRWKQPSSKQSWLDRINVMLTYADERPKYQRQHLKSFFNLGDPYTITINVSNPVYGYVKLNSINLRNNTAGLSENIYPWSGEYFSGVPITLEAVPAPGYVFVGWQGSEESTTKELSLQPQGDVSLTAVFEIAEPATEDPGNEARNIIHYWNFNTAQTLLFPTYSFLGASLTLQKGEGANTEIVAGNDGGFRGENAYLDDEPGTHLRVNEPLNSELVFTVPTTAYSNIKLRFESRRSGQGAAILIVEYTPNGTNYIEINRFEILNDDPQLFTVDFSDIASANGNTNFGIRFKFEQGDGGLAGNNRFDNITIEGDPDEEASPGDPVLSIVDDIKNEIRVHSFPNPFDHGNTVRINVPVKNKVQLILVDLKGKVHYRIENYDLKPGQNDIYMEVKDLAKGVYLLNCQFDNHSTVSKLIKM